MLAHRSQLTLARRILTALLLLSLLGAWSPRPVARAEQTQIPAAEYDALVALYNATDGPNWRNKWTLPTEDPCGLYGVTCTDGHVTTLALGWNNIGGTLPDDLASLSGLTDLYLNNNRLGGQIPTQLGSLTSLQSLVLDSNQIQGTVPPELAGLTSLQVLSLRRNQLTGAIPVALGTLGSLLRLNLGSNLLAGSIPAELGTLADLNVLCLDNNQLTGDVPPQLGQLSALFYLDLGGNELGGTLPSELGTLTALQLLRLNENFLAGPIPSSLGSLTHLRDLDLSHNALVGPVPTSITDLDQLGVPSSYFGSPSVDFGYNALWTDDPVVTAFLNEKDPDWADTQGVADAVTSSDGGELTLDAPDGSSLMVTVPAGGVTETTTLVLIPAANPTSAPGSLTFAGQAFRLEAYREGLLVEPFAFEEPVTLSVTYTDAQIAGLDKASLALYVWEDPAWIDAATTCTSASSYVREPEIDRLSVDICHLSEYALFGAQTDPYPFKVYLPLVKR